MDLRVKDYGDGIRGEIVTAGYGEVYRTHVDGPGTYQVRTCRPAAVGYEFRRVTVEVTQEMLEEAAARTAARGD